MRHFCRLASALIVLALIVPLGAHAAETRTVTDALGRQVTIAGPIDRVICSGAGCLRLLTYLDALDLVVAVDDIEARQERLRARPYALAHPRLRELPVFGEHRGRDNPELILTLDPRPQVIFKTWGGSMGMDPGELQRRTGIPVVSLAYGDMLGRREVLDRTLRELGAIIGRSERAEAVIAFLDQQVADLETRTADLSDAQRVATYVGGVAFKGPHGLTSTEPVYPSFVLAGARNLAHDPDLAEQDLRHAVVAREVLVSWNPTHLFVDLSSLQLDDGQGALDELRHEPAYRTLDAVQGGRVYGLLPYNWYMRNFGSVLANAFFIGKTLYPDRFADVDPAAKADEIYTFLVGAPVFAPMNASFQGLVYTPLPVN